MDRKVKVCLPYKVTEHSFRPVVYICSPYRGDTETNTENAKRYCRFALERNAIPFAPHLLYPQFMDEDNDEERSLALYMGLVMIDKCSELWIFGDRITDGMRGEIARARMRKKTIRYFSADGKESEDNE